MLVTSSNSSRRSCLRHGLTLVELLIVLLVLIAVAAVIVPNVTDLRLGFSGDRKTPKEIATTQTLLQVRAAILGENGQKGLWTDLGGRDADLPQKIAELFVSRAGWAAYDPDTRRGWRGPYLMDNGARYGVNDAYGSISDPAVLDGWGRPIVIQFPTSPVTEPERSLNVRLVSAGENGVIDTPDDQAMPTRTDCKDDVVLFLRVADTRPLP